MKKYYCLFAAIIIVGLYLTCTTDLSGTNNETSGGIIASLYYKDGTPAKNAIIKIFEVSDTTKQPVYTALTDDKGSYKIDSIKVGTYNVWGAKDTLVAFQGSILFTATASNLKDDTLENGGSITGIVGLEPTDDPRTVTVQILGSEISVENVDTSGRFTIPDLAQGSYKLKLATTLPNYTTTYYTIKKSGDIADTLTDTLWLIYTGIPVVTGMKVSYDTLHSLVTLSWDKVQYLNLQDYLVYRTFNDSIQWPTTPLNRTKDILFIDSVFKKSLTSGPFSFSDTNDYHFKYRVCVRNNSDQIGLPYKYVDIKTPSPTKVRTFFSWKYLNTLEDSASINDSVSIIVSYKNANRKNKELCWYVNSQDSVFKTKEDSSLTGADTIIYAWPVVKKPRIYVSMVDEGNTTWWDSTMLNIVQDVPVADAGKDTSVVINSPATLKGTYTQKFGTIVMYKWDFDGDGDYDDSSATNPAMSHTYTHETSYNAKFYVRDDDGNEATDVRIVTVANNPPVITSIRQDTTISIKDSILLTGTAIDNDGIIKEYAWDFEGDGTFEYSNETNPSTGFCYNIAGTYNAIFRVIDDDDKKCYDTSKITVLQDNPVPDAGKDTTVSINDIIRLHGSAKDDFGVVVKWEWDIGNTGTFKQTSTYDTNITAPALENLEYKCVLRVMDDDGNEAKDTIKITVSQDVPVPDAGDHVVVSTNEAVHLHGSATDGFGIITKWEWDIGNTGTFIQTSTSDTNITAPSTELENILCVLSVTDDDGNPAKDTVKIGTFGKVTDIDGNVYRTVKIGNQVWMAENLRVTKYNDGTEIPLVTGMADWNNCTTPAYCYYNNIIDSAFIRKYGALYDWYVVDTKKLAPLGWHVPTDAEWYTLGNWLIANGYNWDGTTTGNKIAKAMAAKTDWSTSGNAGSIGNDLTRNNRSGFSALPGGYRYGGGDFSSQSAGGYWWSATESAASTAYYRCLRYEGEYLYRGSDHKHYGFSVRLLRD